MVPSLKFRPTIQYILPNADGISSHLLHSVTKMETWVFTILICLCIAVLLKSLHDFIFPKLSLPPGSKTVHFVGRLLWLLKSSSNLEPILRNLHAKYGPIVTLQIGSRTASFISDISIAYKALVQNGVVDK